MLKPVKHRQADALARVSWQDFERLLADHYRELGYEVEHQGTAANGARSDGGIDLRLRRGGELLLVQCKHWRAMQVPHNDVHQLIGIMDNEDATGAILVTSGEFTPAAIRAAGKKGRVQLIDGAAARVMLGPRLPPEDARPTTPSPGDSFEWNSVPISDRYRRRRNRTLAESSAMDKLLLAGAAVAFVFLLFYIAYRLLQGALDTLAPSSKPASGRARPAAAGISGV
jgi:restriction system protein